jgi:N-acetylmuramoyl-L-alanine amidase
VHPVNPRRAWAWAWLVGCGSVAFFLSGCAGSWTAGALAPGTLAFADGACQASGPTSGDNHRTVFIDPGHGGPDPGTSGTTETGDAVDERTVTLAVAMDLSKLLRDNGYTVVLSRTTDSSVVQLTPDDLDQGVYTDAGNHRDLLARIQCANQSKADLLVSIHFNAFDDPSVGGVETYYDANRPFSAENLRFAGLVQQDLLTALDNGGWQPPDRGIRLDSDNAEPTFSALDAAYPYLFVLGPAQTDWLPTPSEMPGVLSEALFLSDPYEASIAASDAGQQTIASGLAAAVQDYFAGSSPSPTSGP